VPDTFRFEIFLPRVPGFMEVVQAARQEEVSGISPLSILFFKLQQTMMRLKSWSKRIFGNAHIELHMATDIIYRLNMA
jgi:hypothetical protein